MGEGGAGPWPTVSATPVRGRLMSCRPPRLPVLLAAALTLAGGATAAGRHRRPPGPLSAARAFIADFARQHRSQNASVVDVVLADAAPVQTARLDGRTAYVIAPVLYAYENRGAVAVEPARMAITLRLENGAWRVAGWAWAKGSPPASDSSPRQEFLPPG